MQDVQTVGVPAEQFLQVGAQFLKQYLLEVLADIQVDFTDVH